MSIQVTEIKKRVLAALDDEKSFRYTFSKDIKPNLNSAIEILVSWFNSAFADGKLSPENLREITYVNVYQASSYSRVAFNTSQVGHEMWTLLAVYPKPVTSSKKFGGAGATYATSKYLDGVRFISSNNAAARKTFEQWSEMHKNVFSAGNDFIQGELAEYAYLDFANYGAGEPEITVSPDISGQMVALAYLKYPTLVASENDAIEFPKSITELIVELTLNKISMKQGDSTNLYGTTVQNINRLVSLIK